MARRLNARTRTSPPISRRCCSPSARIEEDVARQVRSHHRRCARARRRGAGGTDQQIRPRQRHGHGRLKLSRRRDRCGAGQRSRRSRKPPSKSPPRASRPITGANCPPMHASPTIPALCWAGAGRSVDSVGLYVPGGTASYPSSVLMNAIPAKVAGVGRIVMVTPASGGKINPLVLAAARRAGVSDIYRIGGAQAVAALAYGTESIAAGGQDRGPRQCLGRRRQARSVRPGGHRFHRRAVGNPGDRRWRQ